MRRVLAALLASLANLALGLAITGWWMQHTIFDPGRTSAVAAEVLEVEGVKDQITDAITNAVATELGQDPDTIALVVDQAAATSGGVDLLSDVVVDSHSVVIGESEGPVVIGSDQIVELLGDDRAALLPPITLPVETVAPLDWLRQFLDDTVPWAFALAITLALLAFTVHPSRHTMVRRWGLSLLVLSVVVFGVGYVLPVVVIPGLTTTPWVQAIPAIAESQIGLLAGISLVCAGAGLGLFAVAGAMRRAQRERIDPYQRPPQQARTWG